ncbi:nitrate- and nitrite sensing domain-containing protein [Streptomyces sp. NBC_01317]|nr:nitrate- and nitrite sensing domain-containing protein [Streptomyces sp. NBC_01317]
MRNRLVVGVALVGVTVVAAGAPGLLIVSADLNDAQNLVTLAQLNQQAVTLSHSLADERDEVVVFIAAGREQAGGDGDSGEGGGADGGKKSGHEVSATRSTRVDRQIDEIRAAATASPGLLRDLATVPSLRRAALTGKGSALEAYRAYSDVIAKLQALADELAEKAPAEAADGTRAPADLGRAVEQASATRGLLLAALAVPGGQSAQPQIDPVTGLALEPSAGGDSKKNDELRDSLSAAAQQSRVRELGALADFDQAAGAEARDSFAATVTGPDVKAADGFLTQLTDRPELSESERQADQEKVGAALSARIDQMRGVESGLGSSQVAQLEKLRDDGVTDLELRVALLGGCLLIAVGVSTAVARTLTRPLAVLRIGAARVAGAPETEEPIRFTGRNDEFAQVVRSLNALHGKLLDLSSRTDQLDSDRSDLIGAREKVVAQRSELQEATAEIGVQLQQLRHTVHHTFVNLSLRTLGLVERQLAVIEGLEEREQEPDRLATLFKVDHLATVMRRHSENLLLLAGYEHAHAPTGPVPLVDVLRAAVSEIERYERVTIHELPQHIQVAGFVADDLSHLVAELLENAASFSPSDAEVELSGWLLENGEVMLSVEDQGVGLSAARLEELNALLAEPTAEPEAGTGQVADGLGLRVTGLLAARHGVRVELREHEQGGVAAVVVLPQALLPAVAAEPREPRPKDKQADKAPTFRLPGSVAESNSNALPGRSEPEPDPLVVAAEQAILKAEATGSLHAVSADADDPAGDRPGAGIRAGARPGVDAGAGDRAEAGDPSGEAALGADAADGAARARGTDTGAGPDAAGTVLPRRGAGGKSADADEEALWAAAEARNAAAARARDTDTGVDTAPDAAEAAARGRGAGGKLREAAEEALWAAAEARSGAPGSVRDAADAAVPARGAGVDSADAAEEALWAAAEARGVAGPGRDAAGVGGDAADALVSGRGTDVDPAEAEEALWAAAEARNARSGAVGPARDADADDEALWAAAEARNGRSGAAGGAEAARDADADEEALWAAAEARSKGAGAVTGAVPVSAATDALSEALSRLNTEDAAAAAAAEEALWAAAEARSAASGQVGGVDAAEAHGASAGGPDQEHVSAAAALSEAVDRLNAEDAAAAEEALWAAAEARSAAGGQVGGVDAAEAAAAALRAAATARDASSDGSVRGDGPGAPEGTPARPGRDVAPAPVAPGPYAIGPDAHERTPDQDTFTMRLPRQPGATPPRTGDGSPAPARGERVTDKGLPKRTPKIVTPVPLAPQERTGSIDAEELRRRLGGFHQGAKNGRRDVEAELAGQTAPGERTAVHTEETGETVEEARS